MAASKNESHSNIGRIVSSFRKEPYRFAALALFIMFLKILNVGNFLFVITLIFILGVIYLVEGRGNEQTRYQGEAPPKDMCIRTDLYKTLQPAFQKLAFSVERDKEVPAGPTRYLVSWAQNGGRKVLLINLEAEIFTDHHLWQYPGLFDNILSIVNGTLNPTDMMVFSEATIMVDGVLYDIQACEADRNVRIVFFANSQMRFLKQLDPKKQEHLEILTKLIRTTLGLP